MNDITRDDLLVDISRIGSPHYGETREVTDEEFDCLAREQGYVKDSFSRQAAHWTGDKLALDWLTSHLSESARSEALRALLTDECPRSGQSCHDGIDLGSPDASDCRLCDGRGWIPKDGTVKTHGGLHLSFPVAWLEAEDER